MTRRSLLLAGAGGLALVSFGGPFSSAQALDRAVQLGTSRALKSSGTTLEHSATAASASGYRRLVAGPGYPLMVREDLLAGKGSRDATRTALASIVQVTDLHIIDAQSPMRFEFLTETGGSWFRPQEALGTQAAVQLVERINALAAGPFTGRKFDCVVSTGDNSDNNESVELDWFLTVMSGGSITANTGSAAEWEGVQSTGDPLYYNPALEVRDRYKQAGFPVVDGYFDRVIRGHSSPGLKTRWYSVFGNHDDSVGGTLPAGWTPLEELYTGTTKFTGFLTKSANDTIDHVFNDKGRPSGLGADVVADPRWQVTADARRAPFSPEGYMSAHLAPDFTGPGPVGHGFSERSVATGEAWYSFPISAGVTGIALDSTNRAGFTHGSIGDKQFRWLEQQLAAGSSRYFDTAGTAVSHPVDDTLFVLFSHHTTGSMDNPVPDPRNPGEKRHQGPELIALMQRFPNVLALVNGHTHSNSITPHPGATPQQGFWEINTASHIEFPQQARVIDVCDNHDGSLSLFTTLIESAAPYQASYSDGSQAALASLYREFSLNDLHYTDSHQGRPEDHNTELLLTNPLA